MFAFLVMDAPLFCRPNRLLRNTNGILNMSVEFGLFWKPLRVDVGLDEKGGDFSRMSLSLKDKSFQ